MCASVCAWICYSTSYWLWCLTLNVLCTPYTVLCICLTDWLSAYALFEIQCFFFAFCKVHSLLVSWIFANATKVRNRHYIQTLLKGINELAIFERMNETNPLNLCYVTLAVFVALSMPLSLFHLSNISIPQNIFVYIFRLLCW